MKEFAGSKNLIFGDISLADFGGSVPPVYSAGAGGWPTIRYFNTETGYDGAPYVQKTSKSMCDELGDMEYMRAYINDKGGPSCLVTEPSKCSDQEQKFIATWTSKSEAEVTKERERLGRMTQSKSKPDQVKWMRQRLSILKQLPVQPADL